MCFNHYGNSEYDTKIMDFITDIQDIQIPVDTTGNFKKFSQ
jgi:hypothetical protein